MLMRLYVIGDIMSFNMNEKLTSKDEEFCSALSVPERISLIKALGENEACACELIEATRMHPAVVSNHMRVLRHAGIVSERIEGEWTYYATSDNEAIEAAARGSCISAVSQGEDMRLTVPAQNMEAIVSKYKSSYMYEAEALFRRGC
jgi:DNA-binding transcriptional ArsR family regulator